MVNSSIEANTVLTYLVDNEDERKSTQQSRENVESTYPPYRPFNALVAWSGKRKKGRGWHDPSHDCSVELSTDVFLSKKFFDHPTAVGDLHGTTASAGERGFQ